MGRRTVTLNPPTSNHAVTKKAVIYINTVTDKRTFYNKPSNPSMPSADTDVASLTTKERNILIGRQRNGWGKAMGDVGLENQSVTAIVAQLLDEGFRSQGYQTTQTKSNANVIVNCTVEDFWGWVSPGFFSISVESRIQTAITLTTISNPPKVFSMEVKSYGRKENQMVTSGSWIETYRRAFENYLNKFEEEMTRM